jgi:outer membrane protein
MDKGVCVKRNTRIWSPPAIGIGWLLVGFLATRILIPAAPAFAEAITVGVVRDGPPATEDVAALIEEELGKHLPTGTEVRFKMDSAFDAGWEPNQIRSALQSALDDPEVDFVLLTGSLATAEAAVMELAKPVVSAWAQRSDLFRVPYSDDGRSLRENYSFVAVPQRIARDLEAFRALVPLESLLVAVNSEEIDAFGEVRALLVGLGAELDLQIEFLSVTSDIETTLSGLDSGVEGVYLTSLPRLSEDARTHLISSLNERRIPTFSLVGHADVERGALAAITPDLQRQVVRRVALNLSRLARGGTTNDLPVLLTVESRLMINAETAVAIGYSPSEETRIFATFLHESALRTGEESLALAQAMKMAEEGNALLTIQESRTLSAQKDTAISRSLLLPDLRADVGHVQTDGELAFSFVGLATDGSTRGELRLRQMIYNDRSVSDFRSTKRLAEGSEQDLVRVRLDVLADGAQSFLTFALAEALYEVELNNLRLAEDNLELSRLRQEVGYSGRDEVLRWEAVVADSRSAVLTSIQDMEASRIALNQTLGLEQYKQWLPEGIEVDPGIFYPLDGRLDKLYRDHGSRKRMLAALVKMALERSSEVGAMEKVVEAQQIQVGQFKRAYFLPDFFADLSYNSELAEGSTTLTTPLLNEDFYVFSLGLSYPIVQGGRKVADVAKAEIDIEGLERELMFVRQKVEQRARTAFRQVENSFPRIELSQEAARAAGENLSIVQDKYAEGIVNVTDLLSAQNQSFTSDQLAAVAKYQFLRDYIDLQRGISWFEEDSTSEEQSEFVQELMEAAGQ